MLVPSRQTVCYREDVGEFLFLHIIAQKCIFRNYFLKNDKPDFKIPVQDRFLVLSSGRCPAKIPHNMIAQPTEFYKFIFRFRQND